MRPSSATYPLKLAKRYASLGVLVVSCAAVLWVLAAPWREGERPSASLAGVVRGTGGAPLAGARVCAICSSCAALAEAEVACASTNGEGRYALSALVAGRYLISAAAVGYAAGAPPGDGSVSLAADARVDIELVAGGAPVAGVVHDATGAPLANARVRVSRADSPHLVLELDADARGGFAVALPKGAFQISARAAGHAPAESYGVAPARSMELRLEPAFELRGKVARVATGEPIAGVQVRAVSRDRMPRVASAKSDAHGAFAFADLRAGSYLVTASGAGVYGEVPRSVELGAAIEPADALIIEAHPAFTLEGRVELERGAPCPEGYVLLGEPDPAQPRTEGGDEAAQSAQGVYGPEQYAPIELGGVVRFGGVPAGRYFASVLCYGHVLQRGPVWLELPRDAERALLWTTKPATRLTARAIDRQGNPVAGARIAISWPGRDQRRVVMPAIAGDDGVAQLASPRCGDCRLMSADSIDASQAVRFAISADAELGTATLVLEGAALELEVRDHMGAPVDGLQVYARPAGAQAGRRMATALGDGGYRFVAMPAGAYVVMGDDGVNPARPLWGSDALPIPVELGARLREPSVFPRSGVFSGRVLDAEGKPVVGAWVSALPEDEPVSAALLAAPVRRVATDRDGRFLLASLAPDVRFKLRAERTQGSAVLLDARVPQHDVQLTLPAPALVTARALDASGAPLTQFTLRARSLNTELVIDRLVADPEGRLSWALPPGPVELTVIAPDGQSGTSNLELTAGTTLDAVVQVGG